jgi:hypothetical protein
MGRYKRNQVEEAISSLLEPRAAAPSAEFRTRLKRLLEADRALARTPRSADAVRANYAFYSADPQGSGVEVWFSTYEAFALLTALRLITHGWSQNLTVQVMRRLRNQLEKELIRTLNQDRKALFDEDAIRQAAQEGDLAVDNTDPVFITVVTRSGLQERRDNLQLHDCAVLRGTDKALKWAFDASKSVGGYTMFEVVTSAHHLVDRLTRIIPRYRGRTR